MPRHQNGKGITNLVVTILRRQRKRRGSPEWPRRRLSGLPDVFISFMKQFCAVADSRV